MKRIKAPLFPFPGSMALAVIAIIFMQLFHPLHLKAQVSLWSDVSKNTLGARQARDITPASFRAIALDQQQFKDFLQTVPLEDKVFTRSSSRVIALPMPGGEMRQFNITESPIMEPALASKFPDIKTYSARAVDDPSVTARLDWTMWGFHAMIISKDGFVFIEPNNRNNKQLYISYYLKDLPPPVNQKFCEMQSELQEQKAEKAAALLPSGTQLRTYRMAVSATGEFTGLNGGTVASALAAVVTILNQVDAIYEREVAIRFTLIGNNNLLIYTDATTDPFTDTATNPCSSSIRSENQTSTDAAIGAANYDIGHVFIGTNIGGCAAGSVVCGGSKAWGSSGVTLGSAFDIGLASHEIGHQFSAAHTFNSGIGACAGAQYAAGSAYEPGGGSTIMSYAGSCDNVQGFRDMFFHTNSFQQIVTFSTTGGGNGCPVVTNTGNTVPTVNAGPSGYIIPISTPFTLTGSGSDGDGDPVTFSWEEFDLGPQGAPNSPSGTAPIFRSFPPVSSPSRTFPKLSDIINNTQTLGEILPSYGRALNFRLTARDSRTNGGGVDYDAMSMTVDGGSGPFRVTSPNTAVTWCPGTQTVTWDVANTNMPPISVANVKISLSTDGGNTFPVVLLASTPNDGTQNVTIPCTKSTSARIKVEAIGNVFFDMSNANFTTGDDTKPTFTVPADKTINKDANCNYDASIAITGDVTDEADNCSTGLNAGSADVVAAGSCVGETIITRTWTLTDGCGNSTVKVQKITIKDVTPPTFTQPADITIYKDASCNHDASVAVTGDVTDEADNCDNTLDATFTDVKVPGSCIGEEIITRTWKLTDDCLNTTMHDQVITVKDTTRPVIANINPDPAMLWAPNHKMVAVTINYTATDNCSPVTNMLSVASNEPINGTGDGNTSPDWQVQDDHHVLLRAERSGNLNGRIYTITIKSTDDCGNVATAYTAVTVSHDQGSNLLITRTELGTDDNGFNALVTPNPTHDYFKVQLNSSNSRESIRLQVINASGQVMELRTLKAGQVLNIGYGYKAGTYLLRVVQGDQHRQIKLIKQ